MLLFLVLESESRRPTSSVPTSLASRSSSARASVGAAAAYPSVKRIANASSSTSTVRGGAVPVGAARAAFATAARAADHFDVAGHGARERLQVRLAGELGVEWLQACRPRSETGGRRRGARRCSNAIWPRKRSARARPSSSSASGLDACQQPERGLQIAGVTLRGGGREQALRTVRGLGSQRGGALEEGGVGRQSAARLRPSGGTLELRGHVLVGHRCRLRPVPGAAIRIDLRIGCFRQGSVDRAALLHPGEARYTAERTRGWRKTTRAPSSTDLLASTASTTDSGIPSRRAARQTSAASPTGSAAATSSKRRASPGSLASRRVKLSSMLADNGTAAGSPNPPASCVGVSPRGSSSRASGFPRVSTTIRSSTCSSSGAGKTDSNSARASRRPSGSTRSSGNPASAAPSSRAANTSAIFSASRRRATNASARADA